MKKYIHSWSMCAIREAKYMNIIKVLSHCSCSNICGTIQHLNIISIPFHFWLYSISCWSLSCFIPGLLEMSPVERGVVTLLGVRSGLFIAMSDKGKLYGSVRTDQGLLIWWNMCELKLKKQNFCTIVCAAGEELDVNIQHSYKEFLICTIFQAIQEYNIMIECLWKDGSCLGKIPCRHCILFCT